MWAWAPLAIAAAQPVAADPCAALDRPSFDVVSVKPTNGDSHSSSTHSTSDGVVITSAMRHMILFAYNLHDFQLSGGPDWVETSTWEVRGKNDVPDPPWSKLSEAERKAFSDQLLLRVQSLLADRFHLKCHTITKELPVYELVVAKGGAKLKESTADEGKRNSTSVSGHNGQMHATAIGLTSERIATILGGEVDRIVLDKAGLTGSYDLTLDWAHDAPAGSTDAPTGPTIFTALEEQLGLKLVPAKGPVPVVVIDAVEKPSEN
jgi:uncharacterized protein (TIGR03435 family)